MILATLADLVITTTDTLIDLLEIGLAEGESRARQSLLKKTTAMATASVDKYTEVPQVATRVGVSMDDIGPLTRSTGRRELRVWSRLPDVNQRRIDEVTEMVGLDRRTLSRKLKKYSIGMRKRHALALALLADPELLVLDEPASGLDPEGIRWLRKLIRDLAAEGRTILLSSHQLAQVQQTVDDVVILRQTVRYADALSDLEGQCRAPAQTRTRPGTVVRPLSTASGPSRT